MFYETKVSETSFRIYDVNFDKCDDSFCVINMHVTYRIG